MQLIYPFSIISEQNKVDWIKQKNKCLRTGLEAVRILDKIILGIPLWL